MRYKLLNTKGMHILCLEDGTRVPAQVSSTTQILREKCRVRVKAFCDERLGTADDTKLKLVDGVLTYGKYILDDISELHYDEGKKDPEFIMGTVSFTVDCDLPETIEQPKPYQA
jgi:hypothetical protein